MCVLMLFWFLAVAFLNSILTAQHTTGLVARVPPRGRGAWRAGARGSDRTSVSPSRLLAEMMQCVWTCHLSLYD